MKLSTGRSWCSQKEVRAQIYCIWQVSSHENYLWEIENLADGNEEAIWYLAGYLTRNIHECVRLNCILVNNHVDYESLAWLMTFHYISFWNLWQERCGRRLLWRRYTDPRTLINICWTFYHLSYILIYIKSYFSIKRHDSNPSYFANYIRMYVFTTGQELQIVYYNE